MVSTVFTPVKSLGRWYDASLSDRAHFVKLRQKTVQGIENIEKSRLSVKLKLCCLHFGHFSLLPRLGWSLTVYKVPLSKLEKIERMIN